MKDPRRISVSRRALPVYRKRRHPFSIVVALLLCVLCGIGLAVAFNLNKPSEESHPTSLEKPVKGTAKYSFEYFWADKYPYIAHAMGAILGQTYTNSYEAFLLNYEMGHRVFEIDLSITEDGYTVLTHDAATWKAHASIPTGENQTLTSAKDFAYTHSNFMSSLWFEKYHTLDVQSLITLMQKYPDAYFMTDSKYFDEEHVKTQFTEIVQAATAVDPAILDRFIVGIYSPQMLEWVMEIHPWKSVVCSLYRDWDNWTVESVSLFIQDSGVKAVCLRKDLLTEEMRQAWTAAGAKIICFTVNNLSAVSELDNQGVDNFITDYLFES